MASFPRVSLSKTQGSPSFSNSLLLSPAGSFPIRAPITPDDDSSDFESISHTDHGYSDTSISIDNGSESDEYVSGEEYESFSEKLFAGDPDEESPDEESGRLDKNKLSRPFVPNPDKVTLGNSVTDEESAVTGQYSPFVETNSPYLQRNMPVAQLTMDDNDFEELTSDDGIVSGATEDSRFSAMISAPRVKVSDFEEDKEDEPWVQRDSSVINKIELLQGADSLGNFVGAEHGVLSSEDNVLGSVSVKLIKHDSHVFTMDAQVEPLMENKGNSQMKEDAKHVVDDPASVESVEDDGQVVPDSEFLVDSKEDVLGKYSQLGDDGKQLVEERLQLENLEEEQIKPNFTEGHNGKSMENDFMDNVSDQCIGSHVKEQISENGCGGAYESQLNQVENIAPDITELKVDGVVLQKEQTSEIVNSSNETFVTVINPVDESLQKIVGSDALEEGNGSEKLKGKSGPETGMTFESLALEDDIRVESADGAFESNGTVDLLEDIALPEMSGVDRLEAASQGNTNSFGIGEEANHDSEKIGGHGGLLSDEDVEELIFGGSGSIEHNMSELEKSAAFSPFPAADDRQYRIDGQIILDSEEELETDKEHEEEKLFDSAALAALLKAATGVELDGGSVMATSASSEVFSAQQCAGSGSSFDIKQASQLSMVKDVVNDSAGEEEKMIIEKIQHIRVKFLRLVQRLGHSPEDSIVAQVLQRSVLAAGLHASHEFTLESSKRMAMQLEAEGKDDLDFGLNIFVIGKTGVGKSATINSLFGEKKVMINAFEPATTRVKEIVGTIDGVRIRILDTPGLRSPVKEEAINRKIFASIKRLIKKFPPDVVLYVDRLDTHARDLNDLPLLASLTNSLTASIWQNAIVTLTHAAAPPPDGLSGSPLSFEVFVAQRSHIVQQAISQAVGDLRLMYPSMMHPVSLVENHPSCPKNEKGESILPNGQSWRTHLLLLCYSLKILSEVSSLTKTPDLFDSKKLFGIRLRPLPLPHLVSSLLQSRPHPKLAAEQGGDDVDSDMELLDLSDSDEEDEYEQLPPFKPLKKSQVNELSKEQRKAYFSEYAYRVKLLQKKQWREEVKKLKELKKKSKDSKSKHDSTGEDVDQEDGGPPTVPFPIPDFVLPPSFDCDNPSYRYRMLEPASQLLVRPVLDSQGWDHDCGYDGVSLERNLAIADQFPGAIAVQITKDKKVFNLHLDSSICAKHGENGSIMAGFDIQTIGRQLGYILRSETKFRNYKINKTSAGISITMLNKNVATGLKIEDQIAIGNRLSLVGNAGAVRSGGDTAYGGNFEVRLKSKDFPVEQDQSTLGLSLVNWRGELGVMANLQSQFSVGHNSKIAIHIGMNNRQSGQITIKTSSSELQLALISIIPMAISILKSLYPGGAARKSNMLD
ncbi:translocase of chloroplast 101, chloroplastic isoform X2 [Manihot esculenta]|uniref:translocase of chloroplast 101, chloroplastic isoform X2 n=1 Tax=Manihot esculenta TaxID=3983 RepID=UPI000B5D8390|nr:translocase of chloroplast 101, chloroplastic isoform X2 [Manihot esculenta]